VGERKELKRVTSELRIACPQLDRAMASCGKYERLGRGLVGGGKWRVQPSLVHLRGTLHREPERKSQDILQPVWSSEACGRHVLRLGKRKVWGSGRNEGAPNPRRRGGGHWQRKARNAHE